MKNLQVTNAAFDYVECLRRVGEHEIVMEQIANSLSTIASLIQAGRDDDSISPWTNDLLYVASTIADYNKVIGLLYNPSDKLGSFEYKEQD